jgi:DNA-binding LytR/AlgR family response regulator
MAVWKAFRADLEGSLRARPFVLGALAGLLLAYLAPFGSDRASAAQRFIYWPGVILAGTLFGIGVSAAVGAVVDRAQRRPILTTVLTALLMTAPGALFILVATEAVFGASLQMTYPALLGPVFLLSLAMTGLNFLARRRPEPGGELVAPDPVPQTPASPPIRFLERLPPRLLGADIHAVQAEDHYLRVHTARGSDLILMRLADAIAELEGLDGAQTHRSWWVARAAIRAVRRSDGRAMLILASGVEAPVSRNFAPSLRERGWL